jgi:hypothetical protein
MIEKLPHYFKKIVQLGPKKTIQVIHNRMSNAIQQQQQRRNAVHNTVAFNWQQIAHKYSIDQSFEFTFESLKSVHFIAKEKVIPAEISADEIIKQADLVSQNCFNLLGSDKYQFTKIDWHCDFRLLAQNGTETNFPLNYYKDIKIESGATEQLVKDIKLPWELSRFQHLFVIGQAFEQTGNEKYAQSFVDQLADWIDKNPVLLGPNWVCPMDVAIRALNWIWAFQFFKNSKTIPIKFWQHFVCSLYDHFEYLENNWEIYDSRTSNHYFSDLIGYFYLCYFFKSFSNAILKKAVWCQEQLLDELDKQVFDEGTSYEGSTSYHQLITEIVYHTFLMSELFGFEIENVRREKFDRMLEFIAWCTIAKNNSIQIGDNDSGKILYWGLPTVLYENRRCIGNKEFPQFGISIVKTDRLHISLRHHAYQNVQPSGHFHNDVGSITLAVDGIEILVDPGSYVYTASAVWRNQFRSINAHNTWSVNQVEPVPLDERLFTLALPEKKVFFNTDNENVIYTQHDLYQSIRMNRKIEHDLDSVTITDWCEIVSADDFAKKQLCWNFIIHPSINIVQNQNDIYFYHQQQKIMTMRSSIQFAINTGWYSDSYGTKKSCAKLVARTPFNSQQAQIFLFF